MDVELRYVTYLYSLHTIALSSVSVRCDS